MYKNNPSVRPSVQPSVHPSIHPFPLAETSSHMGSDQLRLVMTARKEETLEARLLALANVYASALPRILKVIDR